MYVNTYPPTHRGAVLSCRADRHVSIFDSPSQLAPAPGTGCVCLPLCCGIRLAPCFAEMLAFLNRSFTACRGAVIICAACGGTGRALRVELYPIIIFDSIIIIVSRVVLATDRVMIKASGTWFSRSLVSLCKQTSPIYSCTMMNHNSTQHARQGTYQYHI